jgi:hypothetical protein
MIGKRIVPAIIVAASMLAILSTQQSFAQYPQPSSNDIGVGGVTNATLQKCAQLNIDRNQCSDSSILLKERVSLALSNPNGGSGTPLFATQFGQLVLFIGGLGAVFGGVAAAFFIAGRRSKGQITI